MPKLGILMTSQFTEQLLLKNIKFSIRRQREGDQFYSMNGLSKREQARSRKKHHSLRESPQAQDPFKNYEIAKKVSGQLALTPSGLVASSWNHNHLTKLLTQAPTTTTTTPAPKSPSSPPHPPKFPTTKNACQYGYTNVFPLITDGPTQQLTKMLTQPTEQVIKPNLSDFIESSITTPLSPQERLSKMVRLRDEMSRYHENREKVVGKMRLKEILRNRYPHGVQGVESPETTDRVFCAGLQQEVNFRERKRRHRSELHQKFIRSNIFGKNSNYDNFPKQTFQLTPLMKHRKHFFRDQILTEPPERTRIRLSTERDFNIITNLQV